MVLTLGENPVYPIEQFCKVLGIPPPKGIPVLGENEVCVWEREQSVAPYTAHYRLPAQLQQRHKKKYAQGDMDYNSFVFTGKEGQLHLVANNLLLFAHIAEGIDTETWLYHLQRKDFTNWFRHSVHDEELAKAGVEAEEMSDPAESKKHILEMISKKYTA